MFPILDTTGSVVAFGGRVMDGSEPKYLNSTDTPAFKKSRTLFAMNYAKDAVKDREIILCEGYMDVIALHAAGFQNAVATLGTALTQEQARLIAKYADTVVLCYDSDNAGKKATERAIGILGEIGLEIKVLQMTGAKDPDEFIKKFGRDAFQKLIDASASSFDFKLRTVLNKYDINSPDGKLSAAKEICGEAAKINSHVEQELYVMNASKALGLTVDTLKHEVKKMEKKRENVERKNFIDQLDKQQSGVGDKINPERAANLKAAIAEEAILGILLLYPEKMASVIKDPPPVTEQDFVTTFNRRVFTELKQMYMGGSIDISLLGSVFSTDEIARIYQYKLKREGLDSTSEDALRDNISALKNVNVSNETDIAALIRAKRGG